MVNDRQDEETSARGRTRPAPNVIDCDGLASRLAASPLAPWAATLPAAVARAFDVARHGDMDEWLAALDDLPTIRVSDIELDAAAVRAGRPGDCDDATRQRLAEALRRLRPWRKGPFDICGLDIDTEWRSDLKWERLASRIEPLAARTVLDVGCGSGYHAWRMAGAGAGARTVVGLEPMPLYVLQFLALRRYLGDHGVWVLPLRLEDLPADMHGFDTVFSMGVLYHRRSPFDHLRELRGALRAGGQLVLETLVVQGEADTVLVPPQRYARMRNVWFIPSVEALTGWLAKARFTEVALVDVTVTSPAEQRASHWMPFESLLDSLDPIDPERTVEGHPAPRRAILTATAS